MRFIEGQDRHQVTLFPEALEDYIAEDSPVRVIDVYVDEQDLTRLGFKRAVPLRLGRPPYNPKDLLKLYLYGYLNRLRSSRRLEEEAKRNLELIWLIKKLTPDFKTIADFRKDNKKALKNLFRDFNRWCRSSALFGKEIVAIDSTKFRASSSKKKHYSDKKIKRQLKYLDEKIERYLKELDEADSKEEGEVKPSKEEIDRVIRELKERKKEYRAYQKKIEDSGAKEISTVDPDARLMPTPNGVHPGYNVQTAVDSKHKLILDFKVSKKANDLGELAKMALRSKKLLAAENIEVVADKGYYRIKDLKRCLEKGITPYVAKQASAPRTGVKEFNTENFLYDQKEDIYLCLAGKKLPRYRARRTEGKVLGHDYRNPSACSLCPSKESCSTNPKGRTIYRNIDQDLLDTVDLREEKNKEKYRLRQMLVEHPFGTIKRSWDAGYFLTRGKAAVTAEISLTYLAYNFKRAIKVLGVKEMVRRLKEEAVLV